MALRGGESVGRAYVRIYATGDEVPGDIKRIMHEAEPSVREGGREHGRTYADEFDKEMRKGFHTHFDEDKTMFRDLNDNLTESLARLNLADDFFGKSLVWKKFKKRLSDEFGDAGRLAGTRLEEEFRDSTNLEALPDRMRRIGIDVRRAQADILDSMHREAYRMNAEFNANLVRQEKERQTIQRKAEQDSLRAMTVFRNQFKDISEQIDRFEKGRVDRTDDSRSRLIELVAQLRRLAPAISGSDRELVHWHHDIDTMNRRLRESTPLMSKWIRDIDVIGNRMGRLFGLGSRNNFLNFFGSVVRGMVNMFSLFPRLFQFLSRTSSAVQEAFVSAGGGASGVLAGFVQTLGSLTGALGVAGVAVVAFTGFIILLGLVVGPVVAILSELVGILIAMSSSVIMGAIGALAGFGPLLLAGGGVVAGVIALVQTFKDLSDAAPRLKAAVHDLNAEASGLWDTFKDKALQGLPALLGQASHALSNMSPLAKAAGDGFHRMLSEIVDSLDSPAMQAFFDRFARFLPHTMDRLGKIIGDAFGGLAGLLRAAIPLANDLSGGMEKAFDSFNKWANSGKGQEEIKDFLKKAEDSAGAVGDFLKGAFHWLTQLISKSEGTGDSLWTALGGKFEHWAKWIEDHPDQFQQWMDDSRELAHNIGELVDNLNDLIDTLDSAQHRAEGNAIIEGLSAAIGLLSWTMGQSQTAIGIFWSGLQALWSGGSGGIGLSGFLSGIGSAVWYVVGGEWAGQLLHGLEVGLKGIGGVLSGALDSLLGSLRNFAPHGGGAMLITPHVDLEAVQRALSKIPGMAQRGAAALIAPFRGTASRIGSAVGNVASSVMSHFSSLPGRVQEIANQMAARFGNLPERAGRAIGDVWHSISSHFTSIPGQVQGVIDQIIGLFTGLGGRIVSAIGSINIDWPSPPGWLDRFTATGGIFAGAQARIIGEAGPEAVVPLNRPLSQVDPSVRWLSAIAQGQTGIPGSGTGNNKLVSADGWTIVTPSEDPRIVATEVLNELVARVV